MWVVLKRCPYMVYNHSKVWLWITVSLWLWPKCLCHNFSILSRSIPRFNLKYLEFLCVWLKDGGEPMSVRYVVVVTAVPLCSQTHDRGLWGRITEPVVVLTPTAVSRVGIKIWHPWRSNTDTSWAWSQRKCLSPPYINTAALSLLYSYDSYTFFWWLFSLPSSLFPYSKHFPLHHHFSPSSASTPASSSLNPFSPICSVSSHLQNLSSGTPLIFCQLFLPPWASVSVAQ